MWESFVETLPTFASTLFVQRAVAGKPPWIVLYIYTIEDKPLKLKTVPTLVVNILKSILNWDCTGGFRTRSRESDRLNVEWHNDKCSMKRLIDSNRDLEWNVWRDVERKFKRSHICCQRTPNMFFQHVWKMLKGLI